MQKQRVVMILQARMGSKRLPGKSMMLLAGRPLVMRVLERVKCCKEVDEIVLATTMKREDDPLALIGKDMGVRVFRGSEDDLVDRYYRSAKKYNADIIVRIPADNVAPEPSVIDRTIRLHLMSKNDFSTSYPNEFKNGYPDGIGCEVFSLNALERVWELSSDPRNREHPHTYFYEHRDLFKVGTFECPPEYRRPDIVLDVNTEDQYRLMAMMYAELYRQNPKFNIFDIIGWFDNANHAKRKGRAL